MENYVDWNLHGKRRPNSHIIGEDAVRILERLFPKEWVIREYTPDYGIDLNIELFEKIEEKCYITKGEHVFFQVKGKESLNRKSLRMNSENGDDYFCMEVVSLSVDTELLSMVEKMGNAVPVLLVVVDTTKEEAYFVCLNDYIEKIIVRENPQYFSRKTITINIPIHNCVNDSSGIKLIEWYGKRAKLYAFFNKINCQSRDLSYCLKKDYIKLTEQFVKELGRLDVWSAANYFPLLKNMKKEFDYFLKHKNTKIGMEALESRIQSGKSVDEKIYEDDDFDSLLSFREINQLNSVKLLWENFCNIADIFETTERSYFLPNYISCISCYGYDDKM